MGFFFFFIMLIFSLKKKEKEKRSKYPLIDYALNVDKSFKFEYLSKVRFYYTFLFFFWYQKITSILYVVAYYYFFKFPQFEYRDQDLHYCDWMFYKVLFKYSIFDLFYLKFFWKKVRFYKYKFYKSKIYNFIFTICVKLLSTFIFGWIVLFFNDFKFSTFFFDNNLLIKKFLPKKENKFFFFKIFIGFIFRWSSYNLFTFLYYKHRSNFLSSYMNLKITKVTKFNWFFHDKNFFDEKFFFIKHFTKKKKIFLSF